MNNFVKRTLSGFLFISVIIGSILLSKFSFAFVFALICAASVYEFHKITNNEADIQVDKRLAAFASYLLFICSFIVVSGMYSTWVFGIYGFVVLGIFISELFAKKTNPIHNWAYFMLGQVFVALPFSLLNFIIYIHGFQPLILLALFATIWVNDSGAYLVGVSFGNHRLFERISPKKSWEGFFGGAFFALLSGYVFSMYIPEISLINWLIFSELVVVFGTFGDLSESLLKRTINVKDSGNVIPGHGGLLDRFDSMLLAAPVIYFYLSLIITKES